MHAVLLATILAAAPITATPLEAECVSGVSAARVIQTQVQTGTLIFSQGDCLAVRLFTRSPYTHVAAVVYEDGKPFVYDSMNGVGVRRLPLEDYCKAECPNVLHVYQPTTAFSLSRREAFLHHLKSELGRPYGIQHHLSGNRAEGVHCAEYVTDALMACQILTANQPAKVSPDSLRRGIERANLYENGMILEVHPEVTYDEGDHWCDQLWIDSKVCTLKCFTKLGRWFACK